MCWVSVRWGLPSRRLLTLLSGFLLISGIDSRDTPRLLTDRSAFGKTLSFDLRRIPHVGLDGRSSTSRSVPPDSFPLFFPRLGGYGPARPDLSPPAPARVRFLTRSVAGLCPPDGSTYGPRSTPVYKLLVSRVGLHCRSASLLAARIFFRTREQCRFRFLECWIHGCDSSAVQRYLSIALLNPDAGGCVWSFEHRESPPLIPSPFFRVAGVRIVFFVAAPPPAARSVSASSPLRTIFLYARHPP